jgi:tRNA(Ile)-lysidine synthase
MAATPGMTFRQRAVLDSAHPLLPDASLVVALGGGADSAVCAWVAVTSGRRVRAVSVDHGLEASPELLRASSAVAAYLVIGHLVVPAPAASGSEEALRAARYQALEAAAGTGEVILTGHTADDQAETVLGNLLRGSGAVGLTGIPVRRGVWCRPLLDVSRADARAVADELGLPYADDPGNLDLGRRRNLIRLQVIPMLEERIGPAVRPALGRAARLVAADDAELEKRAATVSVRVSGDEVRLPASALSTLPSPVASRVARRALRTLEGLYPGDQGDVAAVLLVAAGGPSSLPLSSGHTVARQGPWVVLRRAGAAPVPRPVALAVPGRALFGPWEFRAANAGSAPVPRHVGRRHALVDPAAIRGGLIVRVAVPGERVGVGEGSKPVAEALREAGVPSAVRSHWPVIESDGTIVWVFGARVAAVAAPRSDIVVALSGKEMA